MSQELSRLTAQSQHLQTVRAEQATDAYWDLKARELGFTYPGEIVYNVVRVATGQ